MHVKASDNFIFNSLNWEKHVTWRMDSKMSHIYIAQSCFVIKIKEGENNATILMNFNSTVLRKKFRNQRTKTTYYTILLVWLSLKQKIIETERYRHLLRVGLIVGGKSVKAMRKPLERNAVVPIWSCWLF